MTSTSDLRKFIGDASWGKNLNGSLVTNRDNFLSSAKMLRTPSGRTEVGWANPFKWTQMYKEIGTVSSSIYGSDESTINSLLSIKIKTLVVQSIGCFSGAKITFQSLDPEDSTYWSERWEYYRFSYAMAVWALGKEVNMIEIFNEPDIALGIFFFIFQDNTYMLL